jgi:hypothetical protein
MARFVLRGLHASGSFNTPEAGAMCTFAREHAAAARLCTPWTSENSPKAAAGSRQPQIVHEQLCTGQTLIACARCPRGQ